MNKLKKYYNDLEPEELVLLLAFGVPMVLSVWLFLLFLIYKMFGG